MEPSHSIFISVAFFFFLFTVCSTVIALRRRHIDYLKQSNGRFINFFSSSIFVPMIRFYCSQLNRCTFIHSLSTAFFLPSQSFRLLVVLFGPKLQNKLALEKFSNKNSEGKMEDMKWRFGRGIAIMQNNREKRKANGEEKQWN